MGKLFFSFFVFCFFNIANADVTYRLDLQWSFQNKKCTHHEAKISKDYNVFWTKLYEIDSNTGLETEITDLADSSRILLYIKDRSSHCDIYPHWSACNDDNFINFYRIGQSFAFNPIAQRLNEPFVVEVVDRVTGASSVASFEVIDSTEGLCP